MPHEGAEPTQAEKDIFKNSLRGLNLQELEAVLVSLPESENPDGTDADIDADTAAARWQETYNKKNWKRNFLKIMIALEQRRIQNSN